MANRNKRNQEATEYLIRERSWDKEMKAIKIPDTVNDKDWAPVWRELVENGGLTRISLTKDSKTRIYLVQDQQLKILKRKNFPFEEVDYQK